MSKTRQKAEIANSVGVTHTLKVTVPDTWEVVPLETVLEDIVGGGTPSRDNPSYWDGPIPWLTVKDMRTRRPEDSIDHISKVAVRDSATNIIPADTVIIATRIGLGKVIRVPYDAAINQDLKALITKPTVNKSYLEYWIYSIANYLESIGSGTTVKGIRLEHVRSLPFPLAPLDQQKHIVAEIEKQFSRLDEAVANLKRVKANLKRYKAAVLKAAVEGRLVETEAELARKKTPSHLAGEGGGEGVGYETGAQLLQRILETRRSQWKGKGKYKEPAAPDTTDLPELPEGWAWATVLQVSDVASGNTPTGILNAVKPAGDVPWFKVGDMNHEENQQVMRHAEAWLSHAEVKGLGLRLFQPNTVLFPKRGGAIATNKKRRLDSAGCADLNVMGITPVSEIAPYFFTWFDGIDLGSLSDGSNVPQINHKDIEPLLIPLPPLSEQHRIVAEVDRRLSVSKEIGVQVNINLKRSERLRQAFLSNAFSGSMSSVALVTRVSHAAIGESNV